MKHPTGLRQRLTLSIFIYIVLLSIAIAIHGYVVNDRAEQSIWASLLQHELVYFEQEHEQNPQYRWKDTNTLHLYGKLNGASIPAEFSALSEGVHDGVEKGNREYVLLVRGTGLEQTVLALDISKMENTEESLTWTIILFSVAMILVLALITYIGVGRLVQPLVMMAQNIAALNPNQRGQRILVPPAAPLEVSIIGHALNEHLLRSDEYIERELSFINITSHELRTPVAVIASTAEVALDPKQPDSSITKDSCLHRILQTARGMKELLTLLLALAKDPSRLRDSGESVDIAELIPSIIQDHLFLIEQKELSFELNLSPLMVNAPLQIIRATIGNLVRNAIENSDRGIITITTLNNGQMTISDPGHGMSEVELSRIYTQMARSRVAMSGGGIGIDLIQRICGHFGWKVTFSSQQNQGTMVVLIFGS